VSFLRRKAPSPELLIRQLREYGQLRLRRVGGKAHASLLLPDGTVVQTVVGSVEWTNAVDAIRASIHRKAPPVETMVRLAELLVGTTAVPGFTGEGEVGFGYGTELSESSETKEPSVEDLLVREDPKYVPMAVGSLTDQEVFHRAFGAHQNLLLVGKPGAGKSMAVRQFAYDERLPLFELDAHDGLESDDVVGKYVKDGTEWVFRPGRLLQLLEHGGILLVDEIDSAREGLLSRFHNLLATRRFTVPEHEGEAVQAHDRFFFVATTNDQGYSRLPARFRDRFSILAYDYDPKVEARLCPDPRLRHAFEQVRSDPRVVTPASTRQLFALHRNVGLYGPDVAVTILLQQFRPSERPFIVQHFNEVRTEVPERIRVRR
jgi:MoxR-like ATPase